MSKVLPHQRHGNVGLWILKSTLLIFLLLLIIVSPTTPGSKLSFPVRETIGRQIFKTGKLDHDLEGTRISIEHHLGEHATRVPGFTREGTLSRRVHHAMLSVVVAIPVILQSRQLGFNRMLNLLGIVIQMTIELNIHYEPCAHTTSQ